MPACTRATGTTTSTRMGTTFDGTYLLTAKGTLRRPIVIRAAGDGEVVFDGDGAFRLFDVMGAAHHIFDGTHDSQHRGGVLGRRQRRRGREGTHRPELPDSRASGSASTTQFAGSKDFYIADNVFIGRDDHCRVARLGESRPLRRASDQQLLRDEGVRVGPRRSRTTPWRSSTTASRCRRTAFPSRSRTQAVAIDIYNNDIYVTGDDFIEADGGVHNIRIMRNRGVNAAHTGLSAQPIFGGPAYYIRNVVYNTPVALKFSNPAGVIVYHNTIVAENSTNQQVSNAHFAEQPVSRHGSPDRHRVARRADDLLDLRLRRIPSEPGRAEQNYTWIGAKPACARLRLRRKSAPQRFTTLAELAAATGQETHGIEIDYDIFESLQPPRTRPSRPGKPYEAADLDFRLKAGSKAVDAGVRMPNVNDGFAGKAPDLGAYEVGQPVPVYGPRWLKEQPFYR